MGGRDELLSTAQVSIIDFGVGNLGSVRNMLKRIDVETRMVSSADEVLTAERLLLPGVGAFDRGMGVLNESGLADAVRVAARSGIPILGVCLGMQLLGNGSEEGTSTGLALLDTHCTRLRPSNSALRVPHMGWAWLRIRKAHPLTENLPHPAKFYFAHSYHVNADETTDILAESTYGGVFTSMVVRDNVAGAQFHPEKSHFHGMSLLSSFAKWHP